VCDGIACLQDENNSGASWSLAFRHIGRASFRLSSCRWSITSSVRHVASSSSSSSLSYSVNPTNPPDLSTGVEIGTADRATLATPDPPETTLTTPRPRPIFPIVSLDPRPRSKGLYRSTVFLRSVVDRSAVDGGLREVERVD
jgi:hypothetical protein